MGLAEELSDRTLNTLVKAVSATEITGTDGGAFLEAEAPGGASNGTMRIFESAVAPKIVTTTLRVPARDVVTCMIYAFTDPNSALPHFTLDCSDRPDGHAFHLDLTPRVELATHVAYMDEVFEPLTPLYEAGRSHEGLSETTTSRRQHALMSPWMLVKFADASAFDFIGATVDGYFEHWLALTASGLSAEVLATVADTDLAARDAILRTNIFSPEIDPVWGRVAAIVGDKPAATIRATLAG